MATDDAAPGSDDLSLSEAVGELHDRFDVEITYSAFWQLTVARRVPAVRIGRRYRVRRADLPAIAAALRPAPVAAA